MFSAVIRTPESALAEQLEYGKIFFGFRRFRFAPLAPAPQTRLNPFLLAARRADDVTTAVDAVGGADGHLFAVATHGQQRLTTQWSERGILASHTHHR